MCVDTASCDDNLEDGDFLFFSRPIKEQIAFN